jgi:hypothetical protein
MSQEFVTNGTMQAPAIVLQSSGTAQGAKPIECVSRLGREPMERSVYVGRMEYTVDEY